MAIAETARIPWWREPTKDQWLAWWAAWLGWTLDAFDFTVFLLIMVPIAKEFDVPLTDVAIVFTVTLWMRLVGAVASGWVAARGLHGCGVAGRGGIVDGDLAAALPRVHGRGAARLVGGRLSDVERGLRAIL